MQITVFIPGFAVLYSLVLIMYFLQGWCDEMSDKLQELDDNQVKISPDVAKLHAIKCRQAFDEIQDKKSLCTLLEDKYMKLTGQSK